VKKFWILALGGLPAAFVSPAPAQFSVKGAPSRKTRASVPHSRLSRAQPGRRMPSCWGLRWRTARRSPPPPTRLKLEAVRVPPGEGQGPAKSLISRRRSDRPQARFSWQHHGCGRGPSPEAGPPGKVVDQRALSLCSTRRDHWAWCRRAAVMLAAPTRCRTPTNPASRRRPRPASAHLPTVRCVAGHRPPPLPTHTCAPPIPQHLEHDFADPLG
jgi:hypothetical protein